MVMGAWVGGNFSYPMMISTARSRDSAAAGGSARAQRIPQPRALHEKKKKTPEAKAKRATRAARAAWRHAAARGSARAHRIAQPRALHAKRKKKRLWRKLYLQRARREQHGGMRRRGAQLALTVLRSRARCMRNEKNGCSEFRASPREFSRERAGALRVRVAHVRAHTRAPSTHHRAVALRISSARAVTMRVSRRSAHQPHGPSPIIDSHGSSRPRAVGYPHRHDCSSSLAKKHSCQENETRIQQRKLFQMKKNNSNFRGSLFAAAFRLRFDRL